VRTHNEVIPAAVGSRKGLMCCNDRKLYPILVSLSHDPLFYGPKSLVLVSVRKDRKRMGGRRIPRAPTFMRLEGAQKGKESRTHSPEKASSGSTRRSKSLGFALLRILSARLRLLSTSPTWGSQYMPQLDERVDKLVRTHLRRKLETGDPHPRESSQLKQQDAWTKVT
jgi:hypothetical protein